MKIAFLSESVADESALKIIVAGILKEKLEDTDLPNKLVYRSSSHLDRDLPSVINAVHYNSNAEALVVVSDSDDTPVHTYDHERTRNEKCRLCQLRQAVEKSRSTLKPINEKILKIAVGIPVPAIEAWYLFGKNPHLFENTWLRKQNGERNIYDRLKLKADTYGTTRPSLDLETKRATEEARRIVENNLIEDLEKAFPFGFGKFAEEIRNWKK